MTKDVGCANRVLDGRFIGHLGVNPARLADRLHIDGQEGAPCK